MNNYESPEIEVVLVDNCDILTISGDTPAADCTW